jgi:hypothetical protein
MHRVGRCTAKDFNGFNKGGETATTLAAPDFAQRPRMGVPLVIEFRAALRTLTATPRAVEARYGRGFS